MQASSANNQWNGYRHFLVERIEVESESAKSFYLVPEDGRPCADFRPGQHLQFRLHVSSGPPILRFYTISDCPNGRFYRLTIKREPAPANRPDVPPGASSTYFHDTVKVGSVLEVKAPAGDFYLDPDVTKPAVLIAGGIGITPLLSMVNAAVAHGLDNRDIYFFHALRHGGDHVFKDHLAALAAEHPHLHWQVCYDQPRPGDQLGRDYHWHGRIDIEQLRRWLPSLDMDYYICGPAPMMESIVGALQEQGIEQKQIHTESFGPASSAYRHIQDKTPERSAPENDAADKVIEVTFARSGRTLTWTDEYESLLQFAHDNDIFIDSGCCFGDCATCMTRLCEGQVTYNHPTAAQPDPGTCLPCSCRPASCVTLDV